MIKQGKVNGSLLEKKFKILRTSLTIGNNINREEALANYEKSAREIDELKREEYEENLASKTYVTTTLEDEETRLKELISFIESRIKERNDFIDDYIKVTSNFLDDLPKVSLEENLPDYKLRLANIDEYISNCEEIKKLTNELKGYRNELEKKYENKANNEVINIKLEDELIEEFNKIISKNEYYANLNYLDIENELDNINKSLNEKKEVMNTFISSYQALENAGISGIERDEYLSYVQDAKIDYYNELEKKYYLDIYKLVLDKQENYDSLCEKRIHIDEILRERQLVRYELNIGSRDELDYFANLCSEQFSVIKAQKYNIESIDKLALDIKDCENRLVFLNAANDRQEIVDILREYSEEKFETPKVELSKESENHKEVIGNMVAKVIPKGDNMVIKVSDPVKINVKKATDTAKLVMKKVVIVLEPKKFNKKRNKLKEVENELQTKKKIDEMSKVNVEFEKDFVNLDADNKTADTSDNVFLDTPVVNLETTVVDDKKVTDTIVTDNINFISDDNEPTVSTEIYVDDELEKTPELFSETDPFLDDNKFELEKRIHDIDGDSMPTITNFGTVKPTNMLNKIDEVKQENDDIILPTMGITDTDKTVPIVPGNYIN